MMKNSEEVAESFSRKPAAMAFPEAVEDIRNKKCPTCGGDIGEFRDEISKREYEISGMCQKCQDSVYGGGDIQ